MSRICRASIWLLLIAGCHVPQAASSRSDERDAGTDEAKAPADRTDDRERLADLSPLPDTPLAGPDADHDHIRDDVAAYIDTTYRDQPRTRLAARQYARAQQHGLVYAGDPDKARDAGDEIAFAIECLYAFLPPDDADAVWKELQARTIDTWERFDAWAVLEEALAGGYFAANADPEQACAFRSEGLEP